MKNKKIIFVCTGNTCRSPMAELLLKDKIKKADLINIKVSSAGLNAVNGDKMSRFAYKAMKEMGINPYSFRSKRLTEDMIKKADTVVCMTEAHKSALKGYGNVLTLNEITGLGDIPDPFGKGLEVYRITAKKLNDACDIMIKILLNRKETK